MLPIKIEKILDRLLNAAMTSNIHDFKLAAGVLVGSKLLTPCCENQMRGFCRNHPCGSLHAEAHAILYYFGKYLAYSPKIGWHSNMQNNKKLDLIVVRFNNECKLCNSRPCYNCVQMMKAVNIRRVYYIDNNNNLIFEYVRDMVSIHLSSVARHIHSLNNNTIYNPRDPTFFNNLLKSIFPSTIKRYNLEKFVENNLSQVLPKHTHIIKTEKNITVVIILDSNKIKVIQSIIIDY